MARRTALGGALAIGIWLAGCLPAGAPGTLAPTLTLSESGGLVVPMQNGIPVPSFSWQPRPRIALDGPWRFERATLDADLTMGDRDRTRSAIEAEADERQTGGYDDSSWGTITVPGTMNPPPDGEEGGGWYRRTFAVPEDWRGRAVTLRFGSANYVADVWLNGTWLGYHEGGTTPFAFDLGSTLQPGDDNVLAVRVHTIPLGTRADTLPWGIIDWWNYGGLTGPVWLEAAPPIHVARADVVPHLDAIELEVLAVQAQRLAGTRNPSPPAAAGAEAGLTAVATVFPASVTDANLLDPDPRSLVADPTDPLLRVDQELAEPPPGGVSGANLTIGFGDADTWSPARPALYVLRLELRSTQRPLDAREARPSDTYWTTFGIRHVAVDPVRPRVLLNGEPVFFRGVGLHAEALTFDPAGDLVDGTPHQEPGEVLGKLRQAAAIGADLLRTGHEPADPTTLTLADRLGFAVWEEIPLYHATPAIFERGLGRGIPQQVLREMALRDMNHPSVLFHGLANESTGEQERTDALSQLHEVDREIDGTRLTGQAAYGWNPEDPTHAPLDVAGFTFYHGVFYGSEAGPDTRRALRAAHEANPGKPIMVLEFGRWADRPADEELQARIFADTYDALELFRADEPTGFLSGAAWWTLRDFATQMGGIGVEDFGLYRFDGSLRPSGELAVAAFDAPAGRGSELALEPDIERPRLQLAPELGDWSLAVYLAYALAVSVGAMATLLFVLTKRGGRSVAGRRR